MFTVVDRIDLMENSNDYFLGEFYFYFSVMRNSEPKIILPMENLKVNYGNFRDLKSFKLSITDSNILLQKFQDLELKHNEFILYDGQKARLRYLVRVRIQR